MTDYRDWSLGTFYVSCFIKFFLQLLRVKTKQTIVPYLYLTSGYLCTISHNFYYIQMFCLDFSLPPHLFQGNSIFKILYHNFMYRPQKACVFIFVNYCVHLEILRMGRVYSSLVASKLN